ncbi:MAG: hypothetical protein EBS53_14940, partial [Bacteroidetes bacterium]|nr:hypothetical protein [Bacteroidota bacterium]
SLTGAGDINLGGNSLNITNGGTYSGSLSGTGGLRVAEKQFFLVPTVFRAEWMWPPVSSM